jgi:hypothetical protein
MTSSSARLKLSPYYRTYVIVAFAVPTSRWLCGDFGRIQLLPRETSAMSEKQPGRSCERPGVVFDDEVLRTGTAP